LFGLATTDDDPARAEVGGAAAQLDSMAIDCHGLTLAIDDTEWICAGGVPLSRVLKN